MKEILYFIKEILLEIILISVASILLYLTFTIVKIENAYVLNSKQLSPNEYLITNINNDKCIVRNVKIINNVYKERVYEINVLFGLISIILIGCVSALIYEKNNDGFFDFYRIKANINNNKILVAVNPMSFYKFDYIYDDYLIYSANSLYKTQSITNHLRNYYKNPLSYKKYEL